MKRPRLTLDLDAVRHNVRSWRAQFDGREVWAVVKSDAYGLGAVDVARACVEAGAARLVVFDVEEAVPLRAAGIGARIVHVFATPPDDFPAALHLGVTPSIEDAGGAKALADIAQWRLRRVEAHIAVDTGTGWSGVPASRAGEFAREVRGLRSIIWEGAWTHIAGRAAMDGQLRAFATAVASMRAEGLAVPTLHVAATAPALWGRTTGALRIGVGLYGSTSGATETAPALRTAIDLRATVISVKRFPVATPLGYGGKDVAAAGEAIATLRIGYADGLPKAYADGGAVALVGGAPCAVAGAIGMNCTMIRVPDGATVRVGDEAMLIGDAQGIRIDDVANAASTIPHALVTALCGGMRRRLGVPS